MKKYKKARKMAIILASVLVMDSYTGVISPYINTYAYTEKAATVNATTLNVRSGPGTTYSVVTKLTNGASVTVIDEKNASDGALWYQIRVSGSGGQAVTGYVSKSFLRFPVSYTNDADFESRLTAEGFPESYKVRLRALHAQYPKWVFRAQHTNLDWNTAVKEESQAGKTLVHTNSLSSWKSTVDGAYNWDTSTWIGYDGSTWVTASSDIVKYYMDPRNFLDETNVFQFMTHTYDGGKHTAEGLKTMVKGTFLSGESSGGSSTAPGNTDSSSGGGSVTGPGAAVGPGASVSPSTGAETESGSGKVSLEGPQASITPKNLPILMEYGPGASLTGPSASNGSGTVSGSSAYVNMIMNAAAQSGVNPYVLAAMIIQEQGSSGTGKSISGTESGYEGYYNFFNIEAYQSGTMTAVQRGLWWASQSGNYERPWNSPEKSILGGAFYYGNNYVKVGQDTFYLKKFNVQGSNLYKHQYMTNVQGAASEGAVYSKAYNSDMKQTELEFKIPVYNNMPENPSSQPTGDGNPNNKLSGLSVEGFAMTPTFSRDTLEYNLIVDPGVSNINVYGTPLSSLASVNGTGTITLSSGNNDIKVAVTAQNGSVREYVLRVVRQSNGPTYSSGVGATPGGNASSGQGSSSSGGNATSGPGSSSGPGVSKPSGTDNAGTPGGSNVTIAPNGSANISVQTSTGVISQGPGSDIKVTEAASGSPQQTQASSAAGQSSAYAKGDINGDGKINSLDTLKLQRYLLGLETIPEKGMVAADFNGDGKVNSQDLLLLQKKILGL
ncbi:dockerin type I domain-containing protein [Lacrimispora brassicae]